MLANNILEKEIFENFAETTKIKTDPSRNDLLTDFSKATLKDRYLLPTEKCPQELFSRVAQAYAENREHGQRMYDYISKLWFMPATPTLSNGGTERGLPISCYLGSVGDSLESIASKSDECIWLGSGGGGIGLDWSSLRSIGEPVRGRGHSSGIIPFIRMLDAQILAISQGSLRRGAAAMYLDISHPEIEEFLVMRNPTGDHNRKALNLHHGVVITDEFMEAVKLDKEWQLIDPKSKICKKKLSARELWQRILETRVSFGEPYLIFIDNVNKAQPEHHKKLGLKVRQSNLCAEITLPTGPDHWGEDRTAVCCLGSVNIEKWDEWKNEKGFIKDCLLFLDNVLEDFINKTAGKKGFTRARYSAMRERSVGLGVMGLHSYFQSKDIPFESAMAKSINKNIFKFISEQAKAANKELAKKKGACEDSIDAGGEPLRFSHCIAIAPTASISIICGGTSPCIEPWNNNSFTQKTLSGSFFVKNKYLREKLEQLGLDTEEIWDSILQHEGSVQHLDLPEEIKSVFRTSFEIDQRSIIDLAGDRSQYIDQSQSVNLFLRPNINKWDLHMLHYKAWSVGVKSLYYCRSMSLQRAGHAGGVEKDNTLKREKILATIHEPTNYEECIACQ